MNDEDNFLEQSQRELGPPLARFSVQPDRFWTRLLLGLLLVGYGVAANWYWWLYGPANFNHLSFLLLYSPPMFGLSLLWLVYKTLGLNVLIYPIGVLRVQRSQVEAFPWHEMTDVRYRADSAKIRREYDEIGNLKLLWLELSLPKFQIWTTALTLNRDDGQTVQLTPLLGQFSEGSQLIQQTVFERQWPDFWSRYSSGEVLNFGPYSVSLQGIQHEKNTLSWRDPAKITLESKQLHIKRDDKWRSWSKVDPETIPNLPIFIAICQESWRLYGVATEPEPME